MNLEIQHIIYLLSSVTFILGLKMLSNAKTAKKGNSLAAVGMITAILTAIVFHDGAVSPLVYGLIFGAIAIGTVVGWLTAKRVQMTKMPELVSLFNGMGGACAALIGLVEFHHNTSNPTNIAIILLAIWETFIGVFLILNVFRKPVIIVALVHMILTFTPFLFFPNQSFNHSPLVFTLLGQYIFKNIIIIGALLTLYKQPFSVKRVI